MAISESGEVIALTTISDENLLSIYFTANKNGIFQKQSTDFINGRKTNCLLIHEVLYEPNQTTKTTEKMEKTDKLFAIKVAYVFEAGDDFLINIYEYKETEIIKNQFKTISGDFNFLASIEVNEKYIPHKSLVFESSSIQSIHSLLFLPTQNKLLVGADDGKIVEIDLFSNENDLKGNLIINNDPKKCFQKLNKSNAVRFLSSIINENIICVIASDGPMLSFLSLDTAKGLIISNNLPLLPETICYLRVIDDLMITGAKNNENELNVRVFNTEKVLNLTKEEFMSEGYKKINIKNLNENEEVKLDALIVITNNGENKSENQQEKCAEASLAPCIEQSNQTKGITKTDTVSFPPEPKSSQTRIINIIIYSDIRDICLYQAVESNKNKGQDFETCEFVSNIGVMNKIPIYKRENTFWVQNHNKVINLFEDNLFHYHSISMKKNNKKVELFKLEYEINRRIKMEQIVFYVKNIDQKLRKNLKDHILSFWLHDDYCNNGKLNDTIKKIIQILRMIINYEEKREANQKTTSGKTENNKKPDYSQLISSIKRMIEELCKESKDPYEGCCKGVEKLLKSILEFNFKDLTDCTNKEGQDKNAKPVFNQNQENKLATDSFISTNFSENKNAKKNQNKISKDFPEIKNKISESPYILILSNCQKYDIFSKLSQLLETLDTKGEPKKLIQEILNMENEVQLDLFLNHALEDFHYKTKYKIYPSEKHLLVLTNYMHLYFFEKNEKKKYEVKFCINILKYLKNFQNIGDVDIGLVEKNKFFLINSVSNKTFVYSFEFSLKEVSDKVPMQTTSTTAKPYKPTGINDKATEKNEGPKIQGKNQEAQDTLGTSNQTNNKKAQGKSENKTYTQIENIVSNRISFFDSECCVYEFKNNLLAIALKSQMLVLIYYYQGDKKVPKNEDLVLYPHSDEINCISISKDGNMIASGSEDESLKIFDCYSGKELKSIRYKSGPVIGLSFLPNNKFIAASYKMIHSNDMEEYKLYIFGLESEKCIFNIGFKSTIYLNFTPFKYLLCPRDNVIWINDTTRSFSTIKDFEQSYEPVLIQPQSISSIYDFSDVGEAPNDKLCIFGGDSSVLQLTKNNTCYETQKGKIYCLSMSNEKKDDSDRIIAVGYSDGNLLILKCNKKLEFSEIDSFSLNEEISIHSLDFSFDDKYLVCGLSNANIAVFKLELTADKKLPLYKLNIVTFCRVHKKSVISDLKFRPNYKDYEFITGGYDKRVTLNFLNHSQEKLKEIVRIYKKKIHIGSVYTVAWSVDGKMFLSAGEDKQIIIQDRDNLTVIRRIRNHLGSIWNAEFFSKNEVISGGEDKSVMISDIFTSLEVHKNKLEKGSDIWDFVFLKDIDKLFVANNQGVFESQPFFNSKNKMMHIKNILQYKKVPVKLPEDLNVMPYPLKMNRLQFAIAINDTNYIDDLTKYFKNKTNKEDIEFNYIYSLLYNLDTNNQDAWDYSKIYAADNRNRIRRNLIDLHLMMGKECYRFLHLVVNNVKVIKIAKKFFPEKLLDIFETFFTEPFYIPIKKEQMEKDLYLMTSPYPNINFINEKMNPPKSNSNEKKKHTFKYSSKVSPSQQEELKTKEVKKSSPKNIAPDKLENRKERKMTHSNTTDLKNDSQNDGLNLRQSNEDSAARKEGTDNQKMEKIKQMYVKDLPMFKFDRYPHRQIIEVNMVTFQIVFGDIHKLVTILESLDVEEKIFGSPNLLRVVKFYWNKKYERLFLLSLIFYVIYLILVCLLVLRSFINRFENCEISPPKESWEDGNQCRSQCTDSMLMEALAYKILILIYICVFTLREIFQFKYQQAESMSRKIMGHFFNMWNIIDLLMIVTGFFSIITDLSSGPGIKASDGTSTDFLKIIYSLFFFLSWMRLLDYARGIEQLSFLIRLLVKVTKDMSGFLVVLFYMIIGFALMSFIVQSTYTHHTYTEFISIFYLVLLGNYDNYLDIDPKTHLNEGYSFIIIVAVSIIMVILMLNMLIALISESHERVMEIEKQANVYEKLDLIRGMAFVENWISQLSLKNWFSKEKEKGINKNVNLKEKNQETDTNLDKKNSKNRLQNKKNKGKNNTNDEEENKDLITKVEKDNYLGKIRTSATKEVIKKSQANVDSQNSLPIFNSSEREIEKIELISSNHQTKGEQNKIRNKEDHEYFTFLIIKKNETPKNEIPIDKLESIISKLDAHGKAIENLKFIENKYRSSNLIKKEINLKDTANKQKRDQSAKKTPQEIGSDNIKNHSLEEVNKKLDEILSMMRSDDNFSKLRNIDKNN